MGSERGEADMFGAAARRQNGDAQQQQNRDFRDHTKSEKLAAEFNIAPAA
jgi:hypothetical protein